MKDFSRLCCKGFGASLLALLPLLPLLPLASQAQGVSSGSPPRLLADTPRTAASAPSRRDAPKRLWCADNDDPGFRRSMAQCTSVLDRATRRSCVEHVMEARRDETAQPAFPVGGGFVGGAASPGAVASLERGAVSRDCVY
jgi:hypothetical protein